MPRVLIFFLATVMSMIVGGQVAGQTMFERLVMPGPVIKGHADLEQNCAKCHKPFDKQAQTRLCLDCHDKIAKDRQMSIGFHGKHPAASKQTCKQCHTDHKGRTADIVGLDRETFDHALTDFALTGRHSGLSCAQCHKAGKSYRKAPSACVSCHKQDEPHKQQLGKDCQGCHTPDDWRKTKPFDHSRTKFVLVASHKVVPCRTCHAGEIYKGAPTTCVGCHALQDAHKGRRGTKCESCHQPTKWKKIRFDHNRDTRFALKGAHAKARCESCHRGGVYKANLPTSCNGCHSRNDPHKGQLGRKCQNCHNETGWRSKVAFNHDLTRFPLIGLHATASCESCHKTKAFRDASRKCSDCHRDLFHRQRLGPNCQLCHTPNGWRRWTFDHARQARYPLTGAHENLDCHACHSRPVSAKASAPRTCIGCHSADDVHNGSFGRNCAACHTTSTFRSGRLRRR